MTEEINVSVLPRKYWTSYNLEKPRAISVGKKKDIAGNLTALIISEMIRKFPELQNCSENKFISFQENITKIIRSGINVN